MSLRSSGLRNTIRPTKRRPIRGRLSRVISIASSSAVAADHRAHGLIGTKILGAIDIEQRRQFRARAVDAALDGADRAAADGGGVLVGEAGCADQDQRFALVLRQLVERLAKLLELQMRI